MGGSLARGHDESTRARLAHRHAVVAAASAARDGRRRRHERATEASRVSAPFPAYAVGGGPLRSHHPAFSQRNVTVGAAVGRVLPGVHHERHPEAG